MISKILAGVALAAGAAVWIAAPAGADPDPFGNLGCSCQSPVQGNPADQLNQGIQQGQSDLETLLAQE
ncbi:hypothetical protein I546_0124 [Mycobacterium kansasii 732]|uniref:Secreted protein n=1 Tax=Mycobacterium pseudokansasii TaxID=2341080 RepID=A0A498QP65_9MYCO|nr:hypothetical protein [Mycobacterium pseudokansasii]EUA15328.1 hypothetical protein I546_0124 [Mycobacterium kansasii 732]KZS67309.1 hypothetical protein A4G27_19755 [Mycobacterium kansasii]MBY0386573.1 hypothetical protein [Mycobacterium pseudokansasii]VAZ90815.1 hypothetical protein LAUMK35_01388 [Mycobacterium pseudokansasii]VAZ91728.1 hypothetical protein LAUMK21_01388 [Mycobacterium pseudokansasii]